MAGLISAATSSTNSPVGECSSPCSYKSKPIQAKAIASPLYPLVYVRYKDHIIYKNILQPAAQAAERETVGWLTKQNQEIILIEHDRTLQTGEVSKGQGNGIIILKSCILEMLTLPLLPLQENSNCTLNSQAPKGKGEYALKPNKRKTLPSRNR